MTTLFREQIPCYLKHVPAKFSLQTLYLNAFLLSWIRSMKYDLANLKIPFLHEQNPDITFLIANVFNFFVKRNHMLILKHALVKLLLKTLHLNDFFLSWIKWLAIKIYLQNCTQMNRFITKYIIQTIVIVSFKTHKEKNNWERYSIISSKDFVNWQFLKVKTGVPFFICLVWINVS